LENDALFNLLINNCDNQYALPNKMIKVVVGFNNFTLVFMEFIDPTLTIIGMHFLHLSTLHWLRKIIIGYIEEPSYPSHITFFHIHEIVLQGLHQNIRFYKQTFIIIILRISILYICLLPRRIWFHSTYLLGFHGFKWELIIFGDN